MRHTLSAIVGALAVTMAIHAVGGSAKGTLTVNGKTSTLAYAYARAIPDPFDKTKNAVELVLSDVPLDQDALGDDPFVLIRLADAGKAHAIVAQINADKKVVSLTMHDAAFKKGSPSGSGSHYRFEAQTFDGSTIAGKLYCAEPQEAFGETWDFSATFTAPVTPRPAPKAPATPVSADNPIAQVAVAFLKAAHAGDVVAMKKLVTPEAVKKLESPEGESMVELMKLTAPANPKITSIEMQGTDAATAKVEEQQSSREGSSKSVITLKLVKIGGQWKVNPTR